MNKSDKDFIAFIEFALDWNLYTPDEYIQRYYNLIEREVKKKMNHNNQLIEELEYHLKVNLLPTDTKGLILNTIHVLKDQETEIKRLRGCVGEDNLQCFICRLKQHYKEAYTDGFYKTLENQINKILNDMESENNANFNE